MSQSPVSGKQQDSAKLFCYILHPRRGEREREGEKESYCGQARGETEANGQEEWKRAQRNERQAIKRLISVRQSRAAAGTNFSAASRHP